LRRDFYAFGLCRRPPLKTPALELNVGRIDFIQKALWMVAATIVWKCYRNCFTVGEYEDYHDHGYGSIDLFTEW
jgi:hypothetical protein